MCCQLFIWGYSYLILNWFLIPHTGQGPEKLSYDGATKDIVITVSVCVVQWVRISDMVLYPLTSVHVGGLSRATQPNLPFRKSDKMRKAAWVVSPLNRWTESFVTNLQIVNYGIRTSLNFEGSNIISKQTQRIKAYILPQSLSTSIL